MTILEEERVQYESDYTEQPTPNEEPQEIEFKGTKPMRDIITPLVSVIIPTYNTEKFIIQAIESVLAQTYPNIELIIVDDGSTDNTLEILKTRYYGNGSIIFAAKPDQQGIFTIFHKENGGTASALNHGIRHATGEWLKWLSADDVLYPNAISDMMMLGVQDYSMVAKSAIFYTDYDIIDEFGGIIGEFREPSRIWQNQKQIADEMFKYFFGNGSSSLINKAVFQKCGFYDETLGHSEDYEFWLRATAIYDIKMIHIPIKTLKYRSHPGQLTNTVGGSLDGMIKQKIREKLGITNQTL